MQVSGGCLEDVYDMGEVLGRGHFAVVNKGRHRITGEHVAIKTIKKGSTNVRRRLSRGPESGLRHRAPLPRPVEPTVWAAAMPLPGKLHGSCKPGDGRANGFAPPPPPPLAPPGAERGGDPAASRLAPEHRRAQGRLRDRAGVAHRDGARHGRRALRAPRAHARAIAAAPLAPASESAAPLPPRGPKWRLRRRGSRDCVPAAALRWPGSVPGPPEPRDERASPPRPRPCRCSRARTPRRRRRR